MRAAESRLTQREESLDRRSESLDSREKQLSSLQGQIDSKMDEVNAAQAQVDEKLVAVAGMTAEEAKVELLDGIRDEVTHESAAIIRESEERTKAEADKRARVTLSLADSSASRPTIPPRTRSRPSISPTTT